MKHNAKYKGYITLLITFLLTNIFLNSRRIIVLVIFRLERISTLRKKIHKLIINIIKIVEYYKLKSNIL